MKVLLIGSEGNVGVELKKYLREKGHIIIESDVLPAWREGYYQVDINHPIELADVFKKEKPDIVYLLAAMVSRVTCEASGAMAVQTNLFGVQNVLELCKMYNSKLIYFSTSEVYGNMGGILDEDKTIPRPNNRYGLTKYLSEKLVEYDVKNHNLHAVIVRPFMLYHENETRGDHRSAMIRFAEHLLKKEPIEVHIKSGRSWFHLDDAVKAFEKLIYWDKFDIFNIGSDEFISTEKLARLIADEVGVSVEKYARFIELPDRMTLIKQPNVSKMINNLGVKPRVNIREGVKRVVDRLRKELDFEQSVFNK